MIWPEFSCKILHGSDHADRLLQYFDEASPFGKLYSQIVIVESHDRSDRTAK